MFAFTYIRTYVCQFQGKLFKRICFVFLTLLQKSGSVQSSGSFTYQVRAIWQNQRLESIFYHVHSMQWLEYILYDLKRIHIELYKFLTT